MYLPALNPPFYPWVTCPFPFRSSMVILPEGTDYIYSSTEFFVLAIYEEMTSIVM